MRVSSQNLVLYLYIYLDGDSSLRLSRNFFEVTPGWQVNVEVLSAHLLKDIKDSLKFKSVFDTIP